MKKYTNGDMIRIKPNLNVSKLRNVWPYFLESMDKYLGFTGEVSHVRNEHIRVKFLNEDSFALLKDWVEPAFKEGDWVKFKNYYFKICEIIDTNIAYNSSGWPFRLEDCTLVTELPEKWKVKFTENNRDELIELRGHVIYNSWSYMTSHPFSGHPFGLMVRDSPSDYEEIPLEMLKDFKSKKNVVKVKSFYKLKDLKFEQFAQALVNSNGPWTATHVFEEGSNWYEIFKSANVLDLWSEADEKLVATMDGYIVETKENGIKVGCEFLSIRDLKSIKVLFDNGHIVSEYNDLYEAIFEHFGL